MNMTEYSGSASVKISDLADGPERKTIANVEIGRCGRPVLTFTDRSRLSVNVTSNKVLVRAFGSDDEAWAGQKIEPQLYRGGLKNLATAALARGSPSSSRPWRTARRKTKCAASEEERNKMDMSKYIGGLFLKVDDIKVNGPVRVRVTDVSEGRFDKPDLTFDDGTRLSCNATNGRVLARAYGFESDDWIDKEVELVVGEIRYQGKPQEAILIKPISPPIKSKLPPKQHGDDMNDEIPF